MFQKLSALIIEIAMSGLKHQKYGESEVIHLLCFLAHIAWNRDTTKLDFYSNGEYLSYIKKFKISKTKLKRELISDDLEFIISKMLRYKQDKYPKDKRIITLIGYTSWGTLRVEWK